MKLLGKAGGVSNVQRSFFISEGGMIVELQCVLVCLRGCTENNKAFWCFFKLKFKRSVNNGGSPATKNKQALRYSVIGRDLSYKVKPLLKCERWALDKWI